jgi:hypothetical protein
LEPMIRGMSREEDEAVCELERSGLAEGREAWWGGRLGRLFLASGYSSE